MESRLLKSKSVARFVPESVAISILSTHSAFLERTEKEAGE